MTTETFNLPTTAPINFRERADLFHDYVMNKDNGILRSFPEGNLHFAAFLEGTGRELITFGAIVLGKLFRGEEVLDLLPSLADYYSENYGIYQNGVKDTRSEYWYLMYVNALAAAITKHALMDDKEAVLRFKSSMEKLVTLAHQVDYDFNDQGYDFEAGKPYTNNDAYRQPDTIGGYAYLMQFAYEVFGDEIYRREAKLAMGKYLAFEENPWYEIPSGAMACSATARMKVQGEAVDVRRAVNFALDSHHGSLFVGTFGTSDITGLMRGWRGYSREEASSTAYSLESLVLLPFLLPVVRHNPSFAREVGRYALQAASHMRYFFGDLLPTDAQGRPDLTTAVPYEALHCRREEHSPYAAGDFHGQKSVYGGALLLWWGELVRPTSHPYVLQLDVTMTDFLSEDTTPVHLYYNPLDEDLDVVVDILPDVVDLYNVESGALLVSEASGKATLHLPADGALVIKQVRRL